MYRFDFFIDSLRKPFVLFDLFSMYVYFDFDLRYFVYCGEIETIGVVDGHLGLGVFVLLDSYFGLEYFDLI